MKNDQFDNSVNRDNVLSVLREALSAISHPRFYKSERGFQGELLVELSNRIKLSDKTIIEQEYQKKLMKHGLNIRPDIIIHEPYNDIQHSSMTEGNIAVIELKLKANASQAGCDFAKLKKMIEILGYPIGIFINIDSADNHANLIPEDVRGGRIVSFSVFQCEGAPCVVESQP